MIAFKKRVLVVEDDPSILKMIKFRLEHEGFTVIIAMDGKEALAAVSAQMPIHLVLLDIRLPKLDGYTVCSRIRRNARTAGIPIIILTASESHLRKLADRCIEVGASDWLRKPFRTKDLLEKIQRVLKEAKEESSHG